MKVYLSLVPPGGGHEEYQIQTNLEQLPQPDDYICIREKEVGSGEGPSKTFIVRRVWWQFLPVDDDTQTSELEKLTVEAEYALGSQSSPEHTEKCVEFQNSGRTVRKIEGTIW